MKTQRLSMIAVAVVLAAGMAGGANAQAAGKPDAGKQAAPAKPMETGDVYALDICPISGKKLGTMGDAIVKTYQGREVRFCCAACPPKFEKDVAGGFAKVDEAIIKDQAALYPLTTSVVNGKPLPEKPVDWVYNNHLVRLGEAGEKAEFLKDPAKYIAAIDKAAIEKQMKDYPLTTCPVMKEKLGMRGPIKDVVVGGRLIRVCCDPCEFELRKSPAKFVAMVDEARKAGGEPKTEKK